MYGTGYKIHVSVDFEAEYTHVTRSISHVRGSRFHVKGPNANVQREREGEREKGTGHAARAPSVISLLKLANRTSSGSKLKTAYSEERREWVTLVWHFRQNDTPISALAKFPFAVVAKRRDGTRRFAPILHPPPPCLPAFRPPSSTVPPSLLLSLSPSCSDRSRLTDSGSTFCEADRRGYKRTTVTHAETLAFPTQPRPFVDPRPPRFHFSLSREHRHPAVMRSFAFLADANDELLLSRKTTSPPSPSCTRIYTHSRRKHTHMYTERKRGERERERYALSHLRARNHL